MFFSQREGESVKLLKCHFDSPVLSSFPFFTHDALWKKTTVSISDGSSEVFALRKKDGAQSFTFDERTVSSLTVKNPVKIDDPSPFPALR